MTTYFVYNGVINWCGKLEIINNNKKINVVKIKE